MNNIPVIFLAFSNEKVNAKRHLRHLPVEETGIRKALQRAVQDKLCEVIIRYHATLDTIIEVFREYQDRISIFHFSGHANDYSICLEKPFGEKDIIYTDGFAEYLGFQKGLQLVFLNACATQAQSKLLHEQGVSLVIATLAEIPDAEASELAIQFYEELGSGQTIGQAFTIALSILKSRQWSGSVDRRGLWTDPEPQTTTGLNLWKLNSQKKLEAAKDWSLLKAIDDPLYNLPILAKSTYPSEPFPGQVTYDSTWAKVFWGREYEVRNLYDLIHQKDKVHVYILYGASGVGKSSLLQAGLLPRIPKEKILLNLSRGESTIDEMTVQLQKILLKTKLIEEQAGQNFIIIDGLEKGADRLLPLLSQIVQLLGSKVRFLLSMRSTYLEGWETQLKTSLTYRLVYLPPISSTGIRRVFSNLQKASYNFYGATALENTLVNLLQGNTTAPITPIFQVFMCRLWKAAKEINHSQPDLSISVYRALEQVGVWENFIQDQLQEIDSKAYESGLLFNILQDCSPRVDSLSQQSIPYVFILKKYQHLGQQTFEYLDALISKHILSTPAIDQIQQSENIQLSHSLLRVPLRNLINRSSKGGQEVRRLLAHHQQQSTLLNANQLKLIEDYRLAIPDLSDSATHLIQESNKTILQKQRKEQINIFRIGVIIQIILLAIFYSNIYLILFLLLLVLLYK